MVVVVVVSDKEINESSFVYYQSLNITFSTHASVRSLIRVTVVGVGRTIAGVHLINNQRSSSKLQVGVKLSQALHHSPTPHAVEKKKKKKKNFGCQIGSEFN